MTILVEIVTEKTTISKQVQDGVTFDDVSSTPTHIRRRTPGTTHDDCEKTFLQFTLN